MTLARFTLILAIGLGLAQFLPEHAPTVNIDQLNQQRLHTMKVAVCTSEAADATKQATDAAYLFEKLNGRPLPTSVGLVVYERCLNNPIQYECKEYVQCPNAGDNVTSEGGR